MAALALWASRTPSDPPEVGGPPEGPSAGHPPGSDAREGAVLDDGMLELRSGLEVGHDFEWKTMPRSYDGRGTISGFLESGDGLPLPERWTLVLEPTRFGKAGAHAVRREVQMEGFQSTFEERDLPLGGYRVSAVADGRNCPPQEILLFRFADRPDLPGKDHAHVSLRLMRAGYVDGAVLDPDGRPVADLPVNLEDRGDRSRRTVTTDNAGRWRIDGLRDGGYVLTFGDPDRPFLPAEELNFVGPSHRFPERVVPRLVAFDVLVLDDAGLPLADAEVVGVGQPHGALRTTTGPDGRAHVPHAVPGQYNVRALHPGGSTGRALFELRAEDAGRTVEVRCRRD